MLARLRLYRLIAVGERVEPLTQRDRLPFVRHQVPARTSKLEVPRYEKPETPIAEQGEKGERRDDDPAAASHRFSSAAVSL